MTNPPKTQIIGETAEERRYLGVHVRVRDDDVLMIGKSYETFDLAFEKFKTIHELITNYKAKHVPALVCSTINDNALICYLKEKDVELQLHGWEHVDYGTFSKDELLYNFDKCHKWFINVFNKRPTIFYPPWNGWSEEIETAAKEFGMQVRGFNVEKIEPWYISNNIDKYKDRNEIEILMHWWWGKRKLERAFEALHDAKKVK